MVRKITKPAFPFKKVLEDTAPYGRCKSCGSALTSLKDCLVCERDKQDALELENKCIEMMGCIRSWKTYTLSRFIETPVNSKVLSFCKTFDNKKSNVYIHGPSGCGKSHLAAIIKRRAILNNVLVKTISIDEIIQQLRGDMKAPWMQKDFISMLIRYPLLNLEDLGVEKDTEYGINILYQIVDGRYKDNRNGLVITSNCDPSWIAARQGNDRVVSRLHEMCKIFDMTGEVDWRKK